MSVLFIVFAGVLIIFLGIAFLIRRKNTLSKLHVKVCEKSETLTYREKRYNVLCDPQAVVVNHFIYKPRNISDKQFLLEIYGRDYKSKM